MPNKLLKGEVDKVLDPISFWERFKETRFGLDLTPYIMCCKLS